MKKAEPGTPKLLHTIRIPVGFRNVIIENDLSKNDILVLLLILERTLAMHGKEQLSTIIRNYDFSDIRVTVLDRTKAKTNRADARAFAAKIDSALTGFQDSDVILVALTVKHKR